MLNLAQARHRLRQERHAFYKETRKSSSMSLVVDLLIGLWLILPAYFANSSAPLARGKKPVDGGGRFRGRPLLGNGKTWEGTLFAVFSGTAAGVLLILLYPYVSPITAGRGVVLPPHTIVSVFMISL